MNGEMARYAALETARRRKLDGLTITFRYLLVWAENGRFKASAAWELALFAGKIFELGRKEWLVFGWDGVVATSETGLKFDAAAFDDVPGGDDDDDDDSDDSDIEGDDESTADDNPFSWLIEAGELPEGTRPSEPDKGFWQPDGTWAANESLSVPAVAVTDSAANAQSWRAEVVSDALDEDDALFEASLDTPEAHAAMMELVEGAYAALEEEKSLSELHNEYHEFWSDWEDHGDYGYGPEDNPFPDWLKVNYPKAYRRYLVIRRRQNKKMRRDIASERKALRSVGWVLSSSIVIFEGEVHRVINLTGNDFKQQAWEE